MRLDTQTMLRVWIVVLLTSTTARAGGIVLESYTGERPADAPRLLAPVLEELSLRKYAAGDTVARSYESQVSGAGIASGLPADFAAQVDRGFKAWVGGKFEDAIKVLVPLVEAAHANPGVIAKDPGLRDPLLKGLTALALSYQRIGDLSAMRATFGEIVRSFPDVLISRATYGPDAQQAFEQVRRDTHAAGRGKVTIKVDDTAVVFVNEAYRAVGSTSAELTPGEYRIIVMMNKQPSRNHRVNVRANTETTVEIDARLDQAVRTKGFTGLSFAGQADREQHEAAFAAKFAKAVGASEVVVVGIDKVRDRDAVVGVLVSLQTGREIRRASIPVEPDPSRDKLRALARFLAGDDPAPGLEVQFARGNGDGGAVAGGHAGGGTDEPRDRPERGGGGGRWGGWRFITGGLGVAGLGVGAYLVALDGKCSMEPPAGQQCNDLYATATPGYVALGAGAVFAGISIYLFATHDSAPVVTPTQGGATVGFATRW